MNAPEQRRIATTAQRYKVGEYLVDFSLHTIGRDGNHVRISPKAASVLHELVGKRGQSISRDALLDRVWNRISASDELLTQAIKELRRAFADDPKNPVYIETIPKAGYRLIASAIPYVSAELNPPLKAVDTVKKLETVATKVPGDNSPSRFPLSTFFLATLAIAAVLVSYYFFSGSSFSGSSLSGSSHSRQATIRTESLALTTGIDRVAFAAVSPNGTFVAYSRQPSGSNSSHIYVSTAAGATPALQLTSSEAMDTYPVWSNNGAMIAFLRFEKDYCHIELVAATGGEARSVGDCMPHSFTYFDWAPDSKSLIIESVDMDKSRKSSLSLQKLNLENGKVTPFAYERVAEEHDVEPRYSPDGKTIAFRRGANPYSDIYVVSAAGGVARRLTSVHTRIAGFDWMPDNRHITFSSTHEGKQRLYLLDVTDLSVRPTDAEDVFYPRAARSVNRIVAVRDRDTVNLCQYSIESPEDTSACAVLAPSGARDEWPAYSPDGQSVCFVSNRTGFSQLWLTEVGKNDPVQLTNLDTGETLSSPQWSVDGKQILLIASRQATSRMVSVDRSSQQIKQISSATENVRFGKYTPRGDYLYFVSDRDKSWQLWRRQLSTGMENLVIAESVLAFEFRPDSQDLVFTQDHGGGLYALQPDGSAERLVKALVTVATPFAWQITKKGIYYVDTLPSGSEELVFLPEENQTAEDKTAEPIRALGELGVGVSITISSDSKNMVVPQLSHVASAVVVLNLDMN